MTSTEFTEHLRDLFDGIAEDLLQDEIISLRTFADAGVFTRDDGLVIRMADGTEFQVTVVRSK